MLQTGGEELHRRSLLGFSLQGISTMKSHFYTTAPSPASLRIKAVSNGLCVFISEGSVSWKPWVIYAGWLISLLLSERQPGPLHTLRVGLPLGHRGTYQVLN